MTATPEYGDSLDKNVWPLPLQNGTPPDSKNTTKTHFNKCGRYY